MKLSPLLSTIRKPLFTGCIAIAILLWGINRLSNSYTTEITIPVIINGEGESNKIVEKTTFNVTARIKATGYSTIYLNHIIPNDYFSISIADVDMEYTKDSLFLKLNIPMLESALQKRMSSIGEIVSIRNTQITIGARRYNQKLVPIIANVEMDLGGMLMQVNDIKLNPSSVLVGGESSLIDTLKYVTTEKINLTYKNNEFTGTAKLVLNPYIIYSKSSVSYSMDTERYTEKKEVYKVIVNNKNDKESSFITIPNSVTVTLNIPQSNYYNFNKNNITVVVDYNDAEINDNNKYLVKCISKYPRIKVVNISPKFITILKSKQ